MIRTSLYLRCSHIEQIRRGFSIPDQLARLCAETKAAGEQIVAEYIDQARSGTRVAQRSEYQRLLAATRRHEFDRVRLSRLIVVIVMTASAGSLKMNCAHLASRSSIVVSQKNRHRNIASLIAPCVGPLPN